MDYFYGLVFRYAGKVWLARYDDQGEIQDGDEIDDKDGTYSEMPPNAVSFVAVEHDEDTCMIRDLKQILVEHDTYSPDEAIAKLLQPQEPVNISAEGNWHECVAPTADFRVIAKSIYSNVLSRSVGNLDDKPKGQDSE